MKGIFHDGPTIDPLFQTYLTVAYFSDWSELRTQCKLTLVVCDKYQKQGDSDTESADAIVHF